MRRLKPWTGALAATVLILNAACGGGGSEPTPTDPVDPPVATTVNVSPATAQLASAWTAHGRRISDLGEQ